MKDNIKKGFVLASTLYGIHFTQHNNNLASKWTEGTVGTNKSWVAH